MPKMNNFVAVDWCAGPDRIFFFFKEHNSYSRFSLGDNKADSGYPLPVRGNWGDHIISAADLRFGFTTTEPSWNNSIDHLWLFYYQDDTPCVCQFLQQTDSVISNTTVADSKWAPLLPYFKNIIGVMRRQTTSSVDELRVLLNNGNYLSYDYTSMTLEVIPLEGSDWADLEQYSDRMMTAVLNDYPTFDRYFYIFLHGNEYLRYEHESKKIHGPIQIDDESWPGLPHD
ncbi:MULTISPECIES: hypothetical protein [Pseudomonas]|uniref:hypothetical protein n=1 Tax=Pseudomonas TaxID=286 RepID=UPI000A1D7351|nr:MULTISPECIES: hypothetical protein [Pseudomonas]MCX4219410.1 hypothetical protein [Pseudomonas sp. MCal1]UIN54819.1 hypothetical protein LXN51_00290 [Pseudomonas kribbensis]